MAKTKKFLLLGVIAVVTIGIIMFIIFSNDHAECEHSTKTYTDAEGNRVTETKHICKEKYSF